MLSAGVIPSSFVIPIRMLCQTKRRRSREIDSEPVIGAFSRYLLQSNGDIYKALVARNTRDFNLKKNSTCFDNSLEENSR